MEKLNLNFSGGSNVLKSICWILSYISWLMLVVTGWISIKWLDHKPDVENDGWIIWTIRVIRDLPYDEESGLETEYRYPFQMHVSLTYIVFILSLIVILGGCIIFYVKTIFKKDDQVMSGMMGDFSKFHFFPLFCASALFIIGECIDEYGDGPNDYEDHFKSMAIAGLIFSILGLCSLVFIYIMTDLNTNDWWVLLLLKKGTYSCLIVLMWYYFCYDIFWVRYWDSEDTEDKVKTWEDWSKNCSLAFSIIFGVGCLAFGFLFKDLVVCCMSTLIYVGLTVYYFKIPNIYRKEKILHKNAIGAIDIIMLVLMVVLIVFLLLKYRDQCLKS